jgi:hypothetical protein
MVLGSLLVSYVLPIVDGPLYLGQIPTILGISFFPPSLKVLIRHFFLLLHNLVFEGCASTLKHGMTILHHLNVTKTCKHIKCTFIYFNNILLRVS